MDNLPFVIWMLCFPIAACICNAIEAFTARISGVKQAPSSETSKGVAALIIVTMWIVVGVLLYRR